MEENSFFALLNQQVAAAGDMTGVYQQALDELQLYSDADNCAIILVHQGFQVLAKKNGCDDVVFYDGDSTLRQHTDLPESFIKSVAYSKKFEYQINFQAEDDIWQTQSLDIHESVQVAAPIFHDDMVFAILFLETNHDVDALELDEQNIIKLFAQTIGAEFEKRYLSEQAQLAQAENVTTAKALGEKVAQSEMFLSLLTQLHRVSIELSQSSTLNDLYYNSVRLAQQHLQIDRMAIFLIDHESNKMFGTYGTDENGKVVNESYFSSPIPEHPVVQETLRRKDYVIVIEDTALQHNKKDVGRGWNAMVALWDGDQALGWIAVDNLINQKPLELHHKEVLKLYAANLSQLIFRKRQDEKLVQFNKELEQRVLERTAELASANYALESANRALESANIQLERLSMMDGLTGVSNRRFFDISLQAEWDRAQRHGYRLTLLMIDVDKFKEYNDCYGHIEGDKTLQRVAQSLLIHARRAGEVVARYGGEEFAILLPNMAEAAVHAVADNILEGVKKLGIIHKASNVGGVVSVSVGVASIIPNKELLSTELVEQADKALYRAKALGRDQCVFT
ncbi:sensor domain-containing diguanylate cyclase [Motilimonas sp. E26]|uniref:sensor domain-containing diguanylate cyclase n=1 Tax=Motilimonas sp. E26 TaxID=2865674 RepID=UPI001E3E278A|nr:sensor domain-containing diguanylate cyclase [Motilimonas sp. E26]MCE0558209.1 diguanylate cyclase [Motilimonas sp. E26]